MTHTEITTDFISELRIENASDEIVKELISITETNPNDLLRVFARSWIQENAIKLLKNKL